MAIKPKIMIVITVILAIVVLFTIVGNLSPTITDAADSITDANNCSEFTEQDGSGTFTYNITDKRCYNSSTAGSSLAAQYDLPLNSLFGRSGVTLVIVMAALLIGFIVLAFKVKGK